jgi:hypothetical protein
MNHRLGIQPGENLRLPVLLTRYLADTMFLKSSKFGILHIEGARVSERFTVAMEF